MKQKILQFIIIFIFLSSNAFAAVSLRIKNDELPKTKVFISGSSTSDLRVRGGIGNVINQIESNLDNTGLFDITVDDKLMTPPTISQISSIINGNFDNLAIDKTPDFSKYKDAKYDALLIFDFKFNEVDSKLEIKVRMWDVVDEKQLFGRYYSVAFDGFKKVGNLISNQIFKSITGEKSGHFDTQITYIAESGNPRKRLKRIVLMDFDGSNRTYLTGGSDLVLTPIFTKKPNELVFLRYFQNQPQIFSLDITTKSASKLVDMRKTNFAPSAHPTNPNLLLFSAIENGNANIFEINRRSKKIAQITNYNGINTTPSYSPDAKKIVFSSDVQSGTEKIYVMNYDGTGLRKISNSSGVYSKPVWSPDGSLIAFTKMQNNRFSIGVMTPEGQGEKILTTAYLVEGARWSPNGRYLIYSKKTSAYGYGSIPKLYIMDIVTEYERILPTPGGEGATDPDWGPSWQE